MRVVRGTRSGDGTELGSGLRERAGKQELARVSLDLPIRSESPDRYSHSPEYEWTFTLQACTLGHARVLVIVQNVLRRSLWRTLSKSLYLTLPRAKLPVPLPNRDYNMLAHKQIRILSTKITKLLTTYPLAEIGLAISFDLHLFKETVAHRLRRRCCNGTGNLALGEMSICMAAP